MPIQGQSNQGYTLLELMIALSVSAILLSLAMPQTKQLIATNTLNTRVKELSTLVRYAKNSAILYNQPVEISPIDKGQDWSKGIRVKTKTRLLRERRWDNSIVKISYIGFSQKKSLTFPPNLISAKVSGHFKLTTGIIDKKLIINRIGRIRTE